MNYLSSMFFSNQHQPLINQSLSVICGNNDNSVVAGIPRIQLLKGSAQVVALNKQFINWSQQDHSDSYGLIRRMAQIWQRTKTDQYLVYGKIDSNTFHWELIPYQKCYTFIGRAAQQIQVLWRTIFGGVAISKEESRNQVKTYTNLLETTSIMTVSDVSLKGPDAFCKDDTIQRQWVITGNRVNVLFNYAPIGFGGERLHFLVVPKAHRETFTDVTQEEYSESLALTRKLVTHFTEARKTIKNVYLLHKTGLDAGQSVKHWHLHVVFSTTASQDFWGRLTVFKNILLGSSPMKKEDFAQKVATLKAELMVPAAENAS